MCSTGEDVRHLRRRSLEYLASLLPVDIAIIQAGNILQTSGTIPDQDDVPLDFYPVIDAIAHEVDALWLIPCIVYMLHNHMSDPSIHDHLSTMPTPFAISLISQLHKTSRLISQHFSPGRLVLIRHACEQLSCTPGWVDLDKWMTALHEDPLRFYSSTNVEGVEPDGSGDELELAESMCDSCCQTMRAYVALECTAFWDELPACLGLPAWRDLLSARAMDLAIPISLREDGSGGLGAEDAYVVRDCACVHERYTIFLQTRLHAFLYTRIQLATLPVKREFKDSARDMSHHCDLGGASATIRPLEP
ncbi:hypothetical protein BD626DRAFT_159094 [Schizophyllum amplum]|uniref:Uncharacterized protein n=1 Tax=Schizophyllum amplum TaxID=97359 RepID=A0A550CNU3_9AGAR|nr:hypothetical protein BD626DRAFT_159094 [Auriculariopsis ampla]